MVWKTMVPSQIVIFKQEYDTKSWKKRNYKTLQIYLGVQTTMVSFNINHWITIFQDWVKPLVSIRVNRQGCPLTWEKMKGDG